MRITIAYFVLAARVYSEAIVISNQVQLPVTRLAAIVPLTRSLPVGLPAPSVALTLIVIVYDETVPTLMSLNLTLVTVWDAPVVNVCAAYLADSKSQPFTEPLS